MSRSSAHSVTQILIDKGVKYLYEKGEWTKPGAFLKV